MCTPEPSLAGVYPSSHPRSSSSWPGCRHRCVVDRVRTSKCDFSSRFESRRFRCVLLLLLLYDFPSQRRLAADKKQMSINVSMRRPAKLTALEAAQVYAANKEGWEDFHLRAELPRGSTGTGSPRAVQWAASSLYR